MKLFENINLTSILSLIYTALGKSNKNATSLAQITSGWSTWEPVLTWTTNIPENITTKARYKVIGKTLFFNIRIEADDGNGTTGLAVSLPIAPKANLIKNPVTNYVTSGTSTYSTRIAYVRDDGENNDIKYMWLSTLAAEAGAKITISGIYEIE